jgi:hypothetical protein
MTIPFSGPLQWQTKMGVATWLPLTKHPPLQLSDGCQRLRPMFIVTAGRFTDGLVVAKSKTYYLYVPTVFRLRSCFTL